MESPSQLRVLPKTVQTPLVDTLQRDATVMTGTGTAAGAEQTSRAIEEREKGLPFEGFFH